jgi:hypothetical protein
LFMCLPGIQRAASGQQGGTPEKLDAGCPPFKNSVVPNACLGEFRHGTQVFEDANKNLTLATPAHPANLTHPGLDLVAPCDVSAIFPIADGVVDTVVDSSSDPIWGKPGKKGLGYLVLVHHAQPVGGKDTYSIYLHMSKPPQVKKGGKVLAGKTLLGFVGKTGAAWGCHTHFEIRHFSKLVLNDKRWHDPPNIYGLRDQRGSAVFLQDWENPEPLLRAASSNAAGTATGAPIMETTPQGTHQVRFNAAQMSGINSFLQTHPGYKAASCETLSLTDAACIELNKEWESITRRANAQVQSPFVVWADLNKDGFLDLALPFLSLASVNGWGWRNWMLVVFQGAPNGTFAPVIVANGQWGACFDGMLYHPERKQVEYWCNTGGGSFRWNGSRYVAKPMVGD